jgi:hypothetical protein
MHIKRLVVVIAVLTFITTTGFGDCCSWRQCPPPCPLPEPEVKTLEPEVEPEIFSCPERHIQIGVRSQIVKDISLLEGNINLRSGLWNNSPITVSGGFSFGFVEEKGGIGPNLSLILGTPSIGIQIQGMWWMLTDLDFKQIKIKMLYSWNLNARDNVWWHIGTKALSLYQAQAEWSGGIGFIFGGGIEHCEKNFSLGIEIEFQGMEWGDECLPNENTAGLEAGLYLYF